MLRLPQLLILCFHHKITYSEIHGILCVGGGNVKYKYKEIDKEEKTDNKLKKVMTIKESNIKY